MKRVVLKIKDRDNTIVNILNYIKELTTAGHGFDVEIDPDDKEYHKHFYIDGDGEDKLLTIETYEPKTGQWLRMSDLPEQEDDRYKCSYCGNVIHHKNKINLYTFNSWCGRCGSDNKRKIEVEL